MDAWKRFRRWHAILMHGDAKAIVGGVAYVESIAGRKTDIYI
jgi:hypothetical protein